MSDPSRRPPPADPPRDDLVLGMTGLSSILRVTATHRPTRERGRPNARAPRPPLTHAPPAPTCSAAVRRRTTHKARARFYPRSHPAHDAHGRRKPDASPPQSARTLRTHLTSRRPSAPNDEFSILLSSPPFTVLTREISCAAASSDTKVTASWQRRRFYSAVKRELALVLTRGCGVRRVL